MNILEYSQDSRMQKIKRLIHELRFQTNESFAQYISLLCVHESNLLHNVPLEDVEWENEDSVVDALRQWHINDTQELNIVRFLYRIPTIN